MSLSHVFLKKKFLFLFVFLKKEVSEKEVDTVWVILILPTEFTMFLIFILNHRYYQTESNKSTSNSSLIMT